MLLQKSHNKSLRESFRLRRCNLFYVAVASIGDGDGGGEAVVTVVVIFFPKYLVNMKDFFKVRNSPK